MTCFDYIYPPNEPHIYGKGVGIELPGLANLIFSDWSDFDSTFKRCSESRNEVAVFLGAATQLRWLFDTRMKQHLWRNISGRKILIGFCTESVTSRALTQPDNRQCAIQMSGAINILAVNQEMDFEFYHQLGCRTYHCKTYFAAPKSYPSIKPYLERIPKLVFFGTMHGAHRTSLIKALRDAGLLDVVSVNREDPAAAVRVYNQYRGVANFRSYGDNASYQIPRRYEAVSSGCLLVDFQDIEAHETDKAILRARSIGWETAPPPVEMADAEQHFSKIIEWAKLQ